MKTISAILTFLLTLTSLSAQTYQELVNKGMDYVEQNDYKAAAASFETALRKEPANGSNIMVMINLASMQRHLGEYDEALTLYNTALINHPQNSFFLQNRAALFCEMNRFDDALKDYNSILLFDENNLEALYRQGLLYLEQKNMFEAQSNFKQILKIVPHNVSAQLGLAMIMKYQDEWKEAEELYTDLIFKHKNNAILYYNRAECYLFLKKLGNMQSDLKKATELGYNDPQIHVLRGRLFLAQYDKRLAKESFMKAKEEGIDNSVVDDLIKLCK